MKRRKNGGMSLEEFSKTYTIPDKRRRSAFWSLPEEVKEEVFQASETVTRRVACQWLKEKHGIDLKPNTLQRIIEYQRTGKWLP